MEPHKTMRDVGEGRCGGWRVSDRGLEGRRQGERGKWGREGREGVKGEGELERGRGGGEEIGEGTR